MVEPPPMCGPGGARAGVVAVTGLTRLDGVAQGTGGGRPRAAIEAPRRLWDEHDMGRGRQTSLEIAPTHLTW